MGAIQSASHFFPCSVLIHRRHRFEAVFEGDSLNIQPGRESKVRVIFSPKFEGVFNATLEVVFYHSLLSTCIAVHRTLQGIAGSLEDHKQIESLGQGDDSDNGPTETIQEVPPQKTIVLFPPNQRRNSRCLPDYEVPAIIQEAVNNSSATCPYDKKAPELVSILRPDSLALTSTYVHYFEALLCVEDGHQQCVLIFFFSPFDLTGIFGQVGCPVPAALSG
jgi:hypothetical protein